jgi:transposase
MHSNRISAEFKKNIQLIYSIPGVGELTAITIMSEIGNIKGFIKPKHLVAYFGIDPSVNQSGKFNSNKNVMSKTWYQNRTEGLIRCRVSVNTQK